MQHTAALPSQALRIQYILISGIAVLLTFVLHEFAHWLMGEFLRNEMTMTLNSSFPSIGRYHYPPDATLVEAAGPVATLLQATLFFALLYRVNNVFFYPFLLTPLYMRLLAGVMNIVNLNDEGKVSADLRIGTFTLSLLVCLLLYGMVHIITKKNHYGTGFTVVNVVLVLVFSSILILVDLFFKIRLI